MINDTQRCLIKKIRKFLDGNLYDRLYSEITGEVNYTLIPMQTEEVILYRLSFFSYNINLMYKLLLLGHTVDYLECCKILGNVNINSLINLGLVIRENNSLYSENSIISYHDRYFIVDLPHFYKCCKKKIPDVYIGIDTYKLSNYIPQHHVKKTLDLCTGSGIQGIVASNISDEVFCVEYNKKVAPITEFNILLNESESNTKVYIGDLYEPVKGEKFDLIISNPPFIPTPQNIEYPICGDGGENGLKIIKRIIEGFDSYLSDGGCAMIIGECIGNKNQILLLDLLKSLLSPNNYIVNLILHARSDVKEESKKLSYLCAQIYENHNEQYYIEKWYNMFEKLNMCYYYSFTLKIFKNMGIKSQFNTIHPVWCK